MLFRVYLDANLVDNAVKIFNLMLETLIKSIFVPTPFTLKPFAETIGPTKLVTFLIIWFSITTVPLSAYIEITVVMDELCKCGDVDIASKFLDEMCESDPVPDLLLLIPILLVKHMLVSLCGGGVSTSMSRHYQ